MINLNSIIKELRKEKIFIDKYIEINNSFNSRAFLLESENGEKYFLKNFIYDALNTHNRLKSEVYFSKYLLENNLNNIPKLICYSITSNWILYDWIEGEKVKKITHYNVKDLIEFLIKINLNLKNHKNYDLPNASEACFSIVGHKVLITKKIKASINRIDQNNQIDPNLKKLIIFELEEKIVLINNLLRKKEFSNKDFIKYSLNKYQKCISPSDVGFHNIINSKGKSFYVDFEYAGIDDPCKLIADLILQPDYPIPPDLIHHLLKLVNNLKKDIPDFQKRFLLIFELYKIKWFCIIFNPIIKNRIVKNHNDISKKILAKAMKYFDKFENNQQTLITILEN